VEVDGSSTVYPITEAVAEEFRGERPNIRVTVAKSGTGGGMKKFGKGEIDICDASREMKAEEAKLCQANGVEYEHFMIAYDGIAVCVHAENDWCDGLTVAQLKELYRLDSPIRTWKDLNAAWPDEEIKLFGPGADSGTFDSFNEQVLGKGAKSRTGYTQSEEDNVLVTGVKADEHALGYFGFNYYAENSDSLKLLGIDSGDGNYIQPSEQTIREKTYTPLSRPLFIYVNLDSFRQDKVANFVKFYLDHAATLSKEVDYVPIAEEVAAENQEKFEKLSTPQAAPAGA
jgi:phosphate transport system substrate-binding protein